MPNCCNNYVTVSGTEEQIKRLVETKFDFDDIVPEPTWDDSNKNQSRCWRIQHWGCSCIHNQDEIVFLGNSDGTEVSTGMFTPWTPPIAIYDALVERGMDVKALYFEPANQIWGMYHEGTACDLDIDECVANYGSYKTFLSEDPLGQMFEEHFCASQFFAFLDEDAE